jgi:hypothetical protein
VLTACCVSVCAASLDNLREYEFIQTSRNVALFNNLSESTYSGFRIVFAEEVVVLQAFGVGAKVTLTSNEAGVVILDGEIPPSTTVEFDWPIDGPRIEAAYWIDADELVWVDIHSPLARMWYVVPLGTDDQENGCAWYVPIEIEFKANWSKDPDGLPLVRYQWCWSDGLTLEGVSVKRQFVDPGWYTVVLTVWDAEGLTHSISEEFYIFRYLCAED